MPPQCGVFRLSSRALASFPPFHLPTAQRPLGPPRLPLRPHLLLLRLHPLLQTAAGLSLQSPLPLRGCTCGRPHLLREHLGLLREVLPAVKDASEWSA
jgi:hypothetical protein